MKKSSRHCTLVAIFADNVLRRRHALGLSQEELGEHAGVHRTYIGMLERGEKNVTLCTMERIAKALGVDPLSLLTKE